MKYIYSLILLFIVTLSAQEQLKFSAQLRPRFIVDNKNFDSNLSPDTYAEMRSRLGVQFTPTDDLTLFFQLQDARTFGEEPGTISNLKNVDIHQAYFKIDNLFDLPLSLKAGRMQAPYGTERIIARNNWNNIGRSFDGAVLQIDFCTPCEMKLDLFAFRVGESGFPEDSLDQNVLGAFGEFEIIEKHKLQPFVIYYSSAAATYPFNMSAVGAYLNGNINGFNHTAEFISQFGDERENGPKSLSAYFIGYNATYTFNNVVKPYLSAGVEIYSGDDDLTDDKYKEFNRWFGAGHKYLGYMDYFPRYTFGRGLVDIHVKAGLKPTEKLSIKTALHIFNSDADYILIDGSTTNRFGTEVDIVANYKYNSYLTFESGASLFVPGEIFKERFGDDISTWFYLMAIVDL